MARRRRSLEDLRRMHQLKGQETPDTRVCTICLTLKPLSAFPKKCNMRKGVSSSCKECEHDNSIRRRFGITDAEYRRLLDFQGGRCAICKSPSAKYTTRFHIDHDHTTGRMRGLLCSDCNTGIGLFQDSTTLLSSAIAYLSKQEVGNGG